MSELDDLRQGFLDPPRAYGLVPLWDLNNDLKPGDLRWGLEEQAKQGVTGVFLHPRTGMEVEYLSDEYWRAINDSIREGQALGIETWLYDEYNWPSGVAGGVLLREHPEYHQVLLDYRSVTCAAGEQCQISIPATAQFLTAHAWRIGSDQVQDISHAFDTSAIRWQAPPEKKPNTKKEAWQLVVMFTDVFPGRLWASDGAPWARNDAGALDYLNPDAVQEFIRLTHQAYYQRFGDHFGKQIPGIFTDEPATFYGWQWTPRFLREFQARCGYDLLPRLHELVIPVGNYVKARCDYHQVALDLYAEAFFRQIGQWCEQHNLRFTGHLLYEDKLDFLPTGQGGVFATLREMHMPGIDYLGDRTGYEPTVLLAEPNLGPKTVSSLAHVLNRPRTLVELYGGNGWSTSPARYKNVLNWIEACGVNFICPHAAYVSLKGHRKRDFPASHFVQNPWWRYYDRFAQYVARLSYLNSQGHHVADIALLYPQRTFWVEFVIGNKTDQWRWLADCFGKMTQALLRIQRDYDFLFEETLLERGAQIEQGKIKIQQAQYSTVVLPPLTTIPLGVVERLAEFCRGGGTLLAFGQLPVHSTEQRDDPRLADLLAALFQNENARFIPLDSGSQVAWESLLQEQLASISLPDIEILSPLAREMIYQHRRVGDADLYLVANLSDESIESSIRVRAGGGVEVWDIECGEMKSLPARKTNDGRTQTSYTFQPQQAVWLVIGDGLDRRALDTPARQYSTVYAIEPDDWRIEPESPNCFVLDPWRVRVPGTSEEREMLTSRYDSLETLAAASRAQARAQGMDPSDWTFFMRVAREPQGQAAGTIFPPLGFEFERSTVLHCDYVPDDAALVYEDLAEPIDFVINDKVCRERGEPCFLWDRANRQIDLKGLLRIGANTIQVRTRMPAYHSLPPGAHGLEPIVVCGQFAVREGIVTAPQSRTQKLLSWTELGYPNYSGAMTYATTLTLPDLGPGDRVMVTCERVCETMQVSVNGIEAGVRLWHPFELEIGELVRTGENELRIIVTNTLANLLTRPLPSGLIGRVQVICRRAVGI